MIPPLSPFPGRGAAPDDYIAQADTTMQQLPGVIAGMNALATNLNLGAGVLAMGYLPPVPYAAGVPMSLATQTVQYGGVTYAPILGYLPFTTTGVFEAAKFRVIQGLTAGELAEPDGVRRVGNAVDQRELAEPQDASRLGLGEVAVAEYLRAARAMASYGEPQRRALAQTSVARPNRTFINALIAGEVTIVVANDSISEGADTWYCNAWVRNFAEMLRTQMPWITWNVVNLSLGGRGLRDLQDPAFTSPDSFYRAPKTGGLDSEVWPGGSVVAGRAWRDYVRDAAPDLIIMGHQENMGEDVNFFEQCWNSFKTYTETWAKKPWFCLAPTFLPTIRTDVYDGAFAAAQVGRQAIADFLRLTAMQRGYGLIDVNSQFRMLRDGRRTEVVPYRVERDFRYWGDTDEWQTVNGGAPSQAGGVMSFGAGSVISRVGATARDIDVSANVSPAVNAVFRVSYRSYKTFPVYSVQYGLTSGAVQLYYGTTVIAAATVVPTGICNIRVRATGARHDVFYNGQLVISTTHTSCTYHGTVSVGFPAGSGAVTDFFLALATEADVAPQYFNEVEIFGTYPGSLTTDPDSDGGDGIHHLSNRGVFLVYLTAAQQFIDQVKGILARPQLATSGGQSAAISAPTNQSLVSIPENTCHLNLGSEQMGMAQISFGYRNLGASPGVLQLRVAGAPVASWWLPTTATDDQPHEFSTSAPILVPAGPVDVSLAWGVTPAGQPAMTSGGGGGSRTLSISITPA